MLRIFTLPIINLAESFIDNVIFDKVKPAIGSVVYCELVLGIAEHTGIYVGNDQIVHLDGSGIIESVSSKQFLNRLDGLNTAISIYVSSQDNYAVGSQRVAERALSQVGRQRDYNFLLDNCHQFTSGCLTGNFNNSDNFLWMVKTKSREVINSDNWRVWDR